MLKKWIWDGLGPHLGRVWDALGRLVGALGRLLTIFWAFKIELLFNMGPKAPRGLLDRFWVDLGRDLTGFWEDLGMSWIPFGKNLGQPGPSVKHLGVLLDHFLVVEN